MIFKGANNDCNIHISCISTSHKKNHWNFQNKSCKVNQKLSNQFWIINNCFIHVSKNFKVVLRLNLHDQRHFLIKYYCIIYFLSCLYILFLRVTLRVIPKRTVDNNLEPDRLEGPKAVDHNYFRRPTLWFHNLCLEVLNVHGNELRLFGAKVIPLLEL